jgi:hypothetical protein
MTQDQIKHWVRWGIIAASIGCALAWVGAGMLILDGNKAASGAVANAAVATALLWLWAGRLLPRFKLVRATFVMPPDGIEDRVVQAMAASGLAMEPHSQIGNSFTFRTLGSRLVVTKTPSGIEVAGTSDRIDQLASKLGIIPRKDA